MIFQMGRGDKLGGLLPGGQTVYSSQTVRSGGLPVLRPSAACPRGEVAALSQLSAFFPPFLIKRYWSFQNIIT